MAELVVDEQVRDAMLGFLSSMRQQLRCDHKGTCSCVAVALLLKSELQGLITQHPVTWAAIGDDEKVAMDELDKRAVATLN